MAQQFNTDTKKAVRKQKKKNIAPIESQEKFWAHKENIKHNYKRWYKLQFFDILINK